MERGNDLYMVICDLCYYVHEVGSGETGPNIPALILDLNSRDGMTRQGARERLVSIGPPAVNQLIEMVGYHDAILRREVIKTLGQIASPVSVPRLVHAMFDGDEGVRWLAAEGLIAVGMQAAQPVLQELVADPKSARLRKGAHHYFRAMRDLKGSTRFDELLSALDGLDAELRTQVAAENLLKSGNPGGAG